MRRTHVEGASCDSRDVAWPSKPTVPAGRLTTAPELFPCHLPLASVTACEIKSNKKRATCLCSNDGPLVVTWNVPKGVSAARRARLSFRLRPAVPGTPRWILGTSQSSGWTRWAGVRMPRPERDRVIDGCAGGVLLGRLKAHDSPAQVPMRRSDVDCTPVCRVFVAWGEPRSNLRITATEL